MKTFEKLVAECFREIERSSKTKAMKMAIAKDPDLYGEYLKRLENGINSDGASLRAAFMEGA